jgi:hypothetical protein
LDMVEPSRVPFSSGAVSHALLRRGSARIFRPRRGYGRNGGPVYGFRITAGERATLILICPPA